MLLNTMFETRRLRHRSPLWFRLRCGSIWRCEAIYDPLAPYE